MLEYHSSLFQEFENSKMVPATTTIPEELKQAIKKAHLNLAEILREGLYLLLEQDLLLLPGVNVPKSAQSFQTTRRAAFQKWEAMHQP